MYFKYNHIFVTLSINYRMINMFNLKFKNMKKLTYLLVLMFSLVIMTSCEKDNPEPVVEKTSGELHPEYVGYWENTITYVEGNEYRGTHQWEFDIHDVKAEKYDKYYNDNSSYVPMTYELWEIEGNTIKFYREGYGWRGWTIVTPPTNNQMVITDGRSIYNLRKRE